MEIECRPHIMKHTGDPLASFLRRLRKEALLWKDYRGNALFCPVCNRSFGRFCDFTGSYYVRGTLIDHFTSNALCPNCGSDLRHRLAVQFLRGLLQDNRKMRLLHFAPEKGLYDFLQSYRNLEHITCDLEPSETFNSIRVDITRIPFPDDSFDAAVAIHVLEHIPDDRKAIHELFRILKPGGWALVAIPTYGETTFEDASLDREGRFRMYGMEEHVRLNGLDFREKLQNGGFHVELHSMDTIPGNYADRSITSPHIESDRYLFFAQKAAERR